MAIQRVEIELPKSVYRQLARIAEETAQPIALLAAQSVISNLPPSVEDALPELRAELLALQTLTNAQKRSHLVIAFSPWKIQGYP